MPRGLLNLYLSGFSEFSGAGIPRSAFLLRCAD